MDGDVGLASSLRGRSWILKPLEKLKDWRLPYRALGIHDRRCISNGRARTPPPTVCSAAPGLWLLWFCVLGRGGGEGIVSHVTQKYTLSLESQPVPFRASLLQFHG